MTDFWDGFPVMKRDLERVREILLSNVRSGNQDITKALTSLATRNGKMLRPGFVLIAARNKGAGAKNGNGNGSGDGGRLPDKIYYVAASIELLHMATLVHDDVIDEATTRRGEPTLHMMYGRKEAILMGDFLFSRCFKLLSQYCSIENARRLADVVSQIVAGEIEQSLIESNNDTNQTPRKYLRRIVGKTASLFADSFFIGASENGIGLAQSALLRRIGYSIGMAFQIIDDILDFTGEEAKMGKAPGSDLRQGVFTLPLLYALKNNGNGSGILTGLETPDALSETQMKLIITQIDRNGGFGMAREKAEQYTRRAQREILLLPRGEGRDILTGVAERLLNRTY